MSFQEQANGTNAAFSKVVEILLSPSFSIMIANLKPKFAPSRPQRPSERWLTENHFCGAAAWPHDAAFDDCRGCNLGRLNSPWSMRSLAELRSELFLRQRWRRCRAEPAPPTRSPCASGGEAVSFARSRSFVCRVRSSEHHTLHRASSKQVQPPWGQILRSPTKTKTTTPI